MQFNELIREVKGVSFETLRQENIDYFEAVFFNKELDRLTPMLEKFFGLPAWPSKNELSAEVLKIVEDFGGIRSGQTLYLWNEKIDYVLVMLWPWRDGVHVTIKIIRKASLT